MLVRANIAIIKNYVIYFYIFFYFTAYLKLIIEQLHAIDKYESVWNNFIEIHPDRRSLNTKRRLALLKYSCY